MSIRSAIVTQLNRITDTPRRRIVGRNSLHLMHQLRPRNVLFEFRLIVLYKHLGDCCVRHAAGDVFRVRGDAGSTVLVPCRHAYLLLQEPLRAQFTDRGWRAGQDVLHRVVQHYFQTTKRCLLPGISLPILLHAVTRIYLNVFITFHMG